MEHPKQTDHSFRYFLTSCEIYRALKSLPWVESVERSRKLIWQGEEVETKEALKVRGKQFVFAYECQDGDYAVREKFRFAVESLAGVKLLMEEGGFRTEVEPN